MFPGSVLIEVEKVNVVLENLVSQAILSNVVDHYRLLAVSLSRACLYDTYGMNQVLDGSHLRSREMQASTVAGAIRILT